MNFSRKTILTELNFISKHTKNHIPIVLIILFALFKAKTLFMYFLVYSYLEWIDNCIDSDITDDNNASVFLNNQWDILIFGKLPTSGFERLGQVIYESSFSLKNKDLFSDFFSIQRLDFERKFKIKNQHFLDERNRKLGATSLKFIFAIFSNHNFRFENNEFETYSKFYIRSDNLTDFEKDFQLGFLNIPEEALNVNSFRSVDINDLSMKQYFHEERRKITELKISCETYLSNQKSSLLKTFLEIMIRKKFKKMIKTLN